MLGSRQDLLEPVFRDGEILRRSTFGEVQARVRSGEAQPLTPAMTEQRL
jgi:hypothetical protein